MKIQMPDYIDLNFSEQYILIITVRPDLFAVSLFDTKKNFLFFHRPLIEENPSDPFTCFQDTFYDNDFFLLPYEKIIVINHTHVFTYIPSLIFDEKDKNEYMKFLFSEKSGEILCHTLQKPEMVILHTMKEETYRFIQRSFSNIRFVHHSALLINFFQEKETTNGNRMIVNKQGKDLDVVCFSFNHFLLGNHFDCLHLNEDIYYILFIWKQLNFNQVNDFIYVPESEINLIEQLRIYIRNVIPVQISLDKFFEHEETRNMLFNE
jgi:hypothetical protein